MTLLERCSQVQLEIVRLETLELASKEAARDRERHDQIQPLRIRLEEGAERAKALRQSGVPFPSWVPQPKMLTLYQDYSKALEEPDTGKRNAYGNFKAALSALADTTSEQVKKAIDGLSIRTSDIDDSTLKQFEGIPSLQAKLAAVRRKRADYTAAASVKNRSIADLLTFLARRAELLSLAEELRHEHLPNEVRDFYQAVHSGRATIVMLTESIRVWLETHDQLKDLRITFLPR
jgi:hypothetical protein